MVLVSASRWDMIIMPRQFMLRRLRRFALHRLWSMNHTRILHNGGRRGILDTRNIATVHRTAARRLLIVSTMPVQDRIMAGINVRSTILGVVTKAPK